MAKKGADYKEKIGVIGGIQSLLKATVTDDMNESLRDVSVTAIDVLIETCVELKEDINKQFEFYDMGNK
ncbi:MAG: hypothetical protein ACRCX2_04255 [Paraclostridium sp.]